MGGNKAQRTKGNAKPSNSSRTAELLAGTGSAVTGFIGFSGTSSNASGDQDVLAATGTADDDTSVDSEFRLLMKKLTKKDSVTKLKALQELSDLVNLKDEKEVKQLSPYWPRLFNKLVVDYDWRVREATFRTHRAILQILGKAVVPHLKQIIPAWLLTTFDPYAPAASAARVSFEVIFPDEKRKNVITLCKSETFNFCNDVILNQTLETIGDKTIANDTEIQAKFVKFVSGSLSVLSLVLETIGDEAQVSVGLRTLLTDAKFWKLSKDKEAAVRHAWYKLISATVRTCPIVAVEFAKKICSGTFSNLTEADPIVVATLWEAALSIIASDQLNQFWNELSLTKTLLPQLLNVLKECGRGNSAAIFPNLLPLISRLPLEQIEDKSQFFLTFFEHLLRGLSKAKVQSEVNAVLTAYFECLKFVLVSSAIFPDEADKIKFLDEAITQQLTDLIEKAFVDSSPMTSNGLFPPLTDLAARSFGKWPQLKEKFVKAVCKKVTELFEASIAVDVLVPRTAKFFKCFAGSNGEQVKLKKRVGFTAGNKSEVSSTSLASEITEEHVVQLMSKLFMAAIDKTDSLSVNALWTTFIFDLLTLDRSNRILRTYTAGSADPSTAFLEGKLLKWFEAVSDGSHASDIDGESSENRLQPIVDLFFLLFRKSNNRHEFLTNISRITGVDALERIFAHVAGHYRIDKELASWMLSDSNSQIVLNLAEQLVCVDSSKSKTNAKIWSIVRICFSTELSNQVCLEKVLIKFTEALNGLKNDANATGGQVIEFTCDLIGNLFDFYKPWSALPVSAELMKTLFVLSCKVDNNQRAVIEASWTKGLRLYIQNEYEEGFDDSNEADLLSSIAKTINESIENLSDLKSTMLLVENVDILLDTVAEAALELDSIKQMLPKLMEKIVLDGQQWTKLVDQLSSDVVYSNWFDGQLVPPSSVTAEQITRTSKMIPRALYSVTASADIVAKFSTTFEESKCDRIPLELFNEQLVNICLGLGYAENLAYHRKDAVVQEIVDTISSKLKSTSTMDKRDVVSKLTKNSEQNILFSLGLKTFVNNFSYNEQLDVELDICSMTSETFLLLQLNAGQLSPKRRHELMQNCLNSVLSSEDVTAAQPTDRLALLVACLKVSEKSTAYEPLIEPLLEVFDSLKDSSADILNYSTVYSRHKTQHIRFAATVVELFRVAIADHILLLLKSQKFLDFVLCSLTSWTLNICRHKNVILEELQLSVFSNRVFNLLAETSQKLATSQELDLVAREWEGFYAKKISSALVELLVTFANSKRQFPPHELAVMCSLGEALSSLAIDSLPHLFEQHEANSVASVPFSVPGATNSKTEVLQLASSELSVLSILVPLLSSDHRFFSLTAHRLLLKLSPLVAKGVLPPEFLDQDEVLLAPPAPLLSSLDETDHVVEVLLAEYPVAECCCEVDPDMDSYRMTVSYLLVWLQVIELFSKLESELRPCLASYLRQSGLLFKLFNNLFRLMPAADGIGQSVPIKDMFRGGPKMSLTDPPTAIEVHHLACAVYYAALKKMPALARNWATNQEKRIADIVNSFSSMYVSDLICTEEIKSVQEGEKFGNMVIKARAAAREVFASYTFDEMSIELTVKLPQNHPLGHVTIDGGKRIGVSAAQWRSWLLQLTTFLTHQNGSIMDGLLLWKKNIDNRFEGIEECMICFYILHGSTCQLPKLTCRNCKKRYHTACLYKWFSTSGNSTCPLCRNLFSMRN